ncbi:polyprenyl synthetase family protein [Tepidiforma sp.]|uniref:polyprenyl synthetase family protein n=1 Tax=Tepidiforma sp. TaxID=2682230 RepID=UPI002ADE875D|nr:polyprenyl synthetase family protein [Tepidiforma sp.]
MTAPENFQRFLPLVEQGLRRALANGPDELLRASRYVLGWEDASGRPSSGGGKRLRPLICLEVAAAIGVAPERALPGAVAVELIHNFSLVHDDIQDGDAIRHGRPTAWKVIGQPQAINLGNFLYARGIGQLTDCSLPGAPAALRLLVDAIERMVEGQWSDIAFETAAQVTEQEYLAMVAGKTGALLGAAAGIGSALAGADTRSVEAFRRWGELLGLAFQVRDDYLGTWGDPDATGKSASSDIVRRKRTLPVVYALAAGETDALSAYYAEKNDGRSSGLTPEAVAEILATRGAREHTDALARRLAADADDALYTVAELGHDTTTLRALAAFIVERDR